MRRCKFWSSDLNRQPLYFAGTSKQTRCGKHKRSNKPPRSTLADKRGSLLLQKVRQPNYSSSVSSADRPFRLRESLLRYPTRKFSRVSARGSSTARTGVPLSGQHHSPLRRAPSGHRPHQRGPPRRRRRCSRHAQAGVGRGARDLLHLRVRIHGDDPLRRLLVAAAVVIPLDVQQRLDLHE